MDEHTVAFSHVWEDSEKEIEIASDARNFLIVASGGCKLLHILSKCRNVERIDVVDKNQEQIDFTILKLLSLVYLKDFAHDFFYRGKCPDNFIDILMERFDYLPWSKRLLVWKGRERLLRKGINNIGYMENLFQDLRDSRRL